MVAASPSARPEVPMPPAPPEALYTVETDIYIARRRRVHAVNDARGKPVFHDPHILQVLDWLVEQDVTTARFTDDATAFVITFERVPLEPDPESEPHHG